MVTFVLVGLMGLASGLVLYHFRAQKILIEYAVLKEKLTLQEKSHQDIQEKLKLELKTLSQEIFEEKTKRFRKTL